jgi:urease alpha subunit
MSIYSSESQASEIDTRAWQTAAKLKEKTGRSKEKTESLGGYLSKPKLTQQ